MGHLRIQHQSKEPQDINGLKRPNPQGFPHDSSFNSTRGDKGGLGWTRRADTPLVAILVAEIAEISVCA
jgi:hypothetical protein